MLNAILLSSAFPKRGYLHTFVQRCRMNHPFDCSTRALTHPTSASLRGGTDGDAAAQSGGGWQGARRLSSLLHSDLLPNCMGTTPHPPSIQSSLGTGPCGVSWRTGAQARPAQISTPSQTSNPEARREAASLVLPSPIRSHESPHHAHTPDSHSVRTGGGVRTSSLIQALSTRRRCPRRGRPSARH